MQTQHVCIEVLSRSVKGEYSSNEYSYYTQ